MFYRLARASQADEPNFMIDRLLFSRKAATITRKRFLWQAALHAREGAIMANVTIKAVAKDAGVSIATVSRVLNKNYPVSQELYQRVMRSVERLNYYPNSVARSLKFDSTLSIGLIVSDISNSFFSMISRSVEDVVMRERYDLVVCSTDNQREKELSYLQLLMSKKVDGLILNATGKNDAFIATISRALPVVLCGRRVASDDFQGDFVDSDNLSGAYALTRHLIELGHRKIAILNGQMVVSSARERLEGFRRAMAGLDIPADQHYRYYVEGNFTDAASGYRGAERLLGQDEPPTAIVAMNNELCVGALRYCHEHGIRIPDQVSIASYGKIQNEDLLYVRPSYVVMDAAAIGTRIAELALERIRGKNQLNNREVLFSAELVKGNGVRAIEP